jgi:hypothetical protein
MTATVKKIKVCFVADIVPLGSWSFFDVDALLHGFTLMLRFLNKNFLKKRAISRVNSPTEKLYIPKVP